MDRLNVFFAILVVITFFALPALTIWAIFSHGMLRFALSDLVLFIFSIFMTYCTSECVGDEDC